MTSLLALFCSMIKRKSIVVALFCFFAASLMAQEPQRIDADVLVKKITVLPPTVKELHSVFTRHTKWGDEMKNELITLVLEEVKSHIKAIHNNTIRHIMKTSPREDMVDSVQYEDERWKLALRPLLGADVKAKLLKIDVGVRPTVIQIFEMQSMFDFVAYYEADAKIKKDFVVRTWLTTGETNMDTVKKKHRYKILQYETQQQLWMGRYNKYTKNFLLLQQLLDKINYGETLSAEDRKIVISMLADVQVRALESLEKLIWNEASLVISGELLYNDEQIMSMYAE